MTRKSFTGVFWRQIILLLSLFLALFLFSELVDYRQGYPLYFEELTKGSLVLLIARIVYILILQKISLHYQKAYQKSPPHFMIRIWQFIVFFLTLLVVIIFVLNKSIVSIMALGGIVGAGVALGIGPIILDAFSGLVHESERGFEVGDWLQIDEHRLGKVASISWRAITLETNDHTTIIIPQRKLSDGYINLNRPMSSLMQTVEVTLDHAIPIDRAERLLTGAVSLVEGVYNKTSSAWALKSTEGGMVYAVRYLIQDYGPWREIKHKVLEAITVHLHEYGLKLSEKSGEYALSVGGQPLKEASPLLPEQILTKVELFSVLSKGAFATLCHSAKKQLYTKGTYIVQQGDEGGSLFIVAEGVVEVFLKGKKQIISVAHLSSGAYFGEMSLLTGKPRTASVRAATNCIVFEISKTAVEPLFKKDPRIIEKLAKKIKERNKTNIEKKKDSKHTSEATTQEMPKLIKAIRQYFSL